MIVVSCAATHAGVQTLVLVPALDSLGDPHGFAGTRGDSRCDFEDPPHSVPSVRQHVFVSFLVTSYLSRPSRSPEFVPVSALW